MHADFTELLMSALERQSKIQSQQFDDLRTSISTLQRQLADLTRRMDRMDAASSHGDTRRGPAGL